MNLDKNTLTDNKLYLAAVASFMKFGCARLRLLANRFENMENVWRAQISEIINSGIDELTASEFDEHRKNFDLNKLFCDLEKESIRVIAKNDEIYPELLKHIYDPPEVLFIRGNLNLKNIISVAIVGSRKITDYGLRAIEKIVQPLCEKKCAIISGLALGVDGASHENALKNNGYAIAILGSGINNSSIYPRTHQFLAQKIIESGGAIISEFPLYALPLKHHFPLRNRIISGISDAVLIVEAQENSGSLITARLALEQGRNVYAVPGSIFSPQSIGANRLIGMGAKPVSNANDILEDFNISSNELMKELQYEPQNVNEKAILSVISHESKHIDDIISESNISAPQVMACLTVLETKRIIKQIQGMKYVKNC